MIRRHFSKSISSKINFPFAVVFLFVLVGLVLFATTSRYTFSQMEEFHEQLDHTFLVNHIHASSYRLILSTHHFLLTKEQSFLTDFKKTLDELFRQTNGYIELEQTGTYQEAEQEIAWIKEIQADISRIRGTSEKLFDIFIATGTIDSKHMDELESLAYGIEFKVKQVNDLHSQRSNRLITASKARVTFLGRIFLIFFFLGFILLVLVNAILFRYVVRPVKKLAAATLDLASGNLRRRVDFESEDEVGALARSFNEMAGRLEEHDLAHHEFSTKLEQMVKDRTQELEQTTQNLKATQDRLIRTEKQATIGRLAAGVTHEIRTPLNSLALNFQILKRQLEELDKYKTGNVGETLSMIDMEVSRLNRVLEEFVSYARFPKSEFAEIDINSLIQEVAQYLTPEAEESGVSFEFRLLPDISHIEADEEQMRQLLINLCVNAIQAMPVGGSITLATDQVAMNDGLQDGLSISVSDQGSGIHPEALEGIFEPFYSTKPDGLGLGLAIAARIVEQHNGQISCYSQVGEGTKLEIYVPLKQPE